MHYHLIGIAGTAMGSLAGLLRAKGYRVTGSDEAVYPPMSTLLEELGIEFARGYTPDNLNPAPDRVIVGNAISRGNPELEALLDRCLPYSSAAATIKAEFLEGRHVIAIAGTHGKTTTTSLVAHLLETGGFNPSFLIGGVAENFGSSFRLTGSNHFVIEADEYDTAYFDKGPKMWHYLPRTAVVTNMEFDHADIYRDDIAYRFAFERFINLVPRAGVLVAGWDSPAVRDLSVNSFAPVEGFGMARVGDEKGPLWGAEDVSFSAAGTTFTVVRGETTMGTVTTPLSGAYNVQNALAAIAAATAVGVSWEAVVTGLATFSSVRRRMEVKGTVAGVTVVDDFAHHPTAVRGTIQAARERFGPAARVLAVFEPRSYTAQRREFQRQYQDALGTADGVVLGGMFHPERYSTETGMDPRELVTHLVDGGCPAIYEPEVDAIVEHLVTGAREGDVFLVMSNGAFGGIHERLLAALAG